MFFGRGWLSDGIIGTLVLGLSTCTVSPERLYEGEVYGIVSAPGGAPVIGASVRARYHAVEHDGTCGDEVISYADDQTDTRGSYDVRIRDFLTAEACISVWVAPPPSNSLSEQVVDGPRVRLSKEGERPRSRTQIDVVLPRPG